MVQCAGSLHTGRGILFQEVIRGFIHNFGLIRTRSSCQRTNHGPKCIELIVRHSLRRVGIGAAETLTAIVVAQFTLAVVVVVDHFRLLSVPKVEISLLRIAGIALVAVGAYLVVR